MTLKGTCKPKRAGSRNRRRALLEELPNHSCCCEVNPSERGRSLSFDLCELLEKTKNAKAFEKLKIWCGLSNRDKKDFRRTFCRLAQERRGISRMTKFDILKGLIDLKEMLLLARLANVEN